MRFDAVSITIDNPSATNSSVLGEAHRGIMQMEIIITCKIYGSIALAYTAYQHRHRRDIRFRSRGRFRGLSRVRVSFFRRSARYDKRRSTDI